MKTFHQNHVYTEMVDVELICENLGRLHLFSIGISLCAILSVPNNNSNDSMDNF